MGARSAVSLAMAVAAALVVGCAQAGVAMPGSGSSCATSASADRCQALALAAATQLGVPFESVDAVDVLPNPNSGQIDFAHRTFLSITLVDGSRHPVTINCPGVSGAFNPPCMTDPAVQLGFVRGSDGGEGYGDTPEGSTPFPDLDPSAVAAAKSLTIATVSVPVTERGPHTVVLGQALLPNGYLTEGSFAMADPWPSNILFTGSVSLVVTPTAGGEPLRNLYVHGWHAGVEEVRATLSFDVAWFEPGAVLTLIDVVVR